MEDQLVVRRKKTQYKLSLVLAMKMSQEGYKDLVN